MENFGNSPYIITISGRLVHILNPTINEIDITDIAIALSKICRFTGHTSRFYSVAQHCCLVSDLVSVEYKLWALLHDATEAYLGDVNSPLKSVLTNYKDIETNMMNVIANRFDLSGDIPDVVKNMDRNVLLNEASTFWPNIDLTDWKVTGEKIEGVTIEPWDFDFSTHQYLTRFYRLFK